MRPSALRYEHPRTPSSVASEPNRSRISPKVNSPCPRTTTSIYGAARLCSASVDGCQPPNTDFRPRGLYGACQFDRFEDHRPCDDGDPDTQGVVELLDDAFAEPRFDRGIDDIYRETALLGDGRQSQQCERRGRLDAPVRRKEEKDFRLSAFQ